jgi:hypothetical protein
MDEKRDWIKTLDQLGAVVLTGVTIYVTLQQVKSPAEKATSKARAYRGAAELYGNLAEYFGKRALRAEIAYYQEIRL